MVIRSELLEPRGRRLRTAGQPEEDVIEAQQAGEGGAAIVRDLRPERGGKLLEHRIVEAVPRVEVAADDGRSTTSSSKALRRLKGAIPIPKENRHES